MKIGGTFSALHNPVILGLLGLNAAQDAAGVYGALKQAHDNDFLAKAYLTGQVQTSMPGSPLRHAFSRLTGGLVSPDINPSGENLVEQEELIGKERATELGNEEKSFNLRKGLGLEGFNQLAQNRPNLGLGQYGFPNELPSEEKERKAQELAQKKYDLEFQDKDPVAKLKYEKEKKLQDAQVDLQTKPGIAAAEARARAPIQISTAAGEAAAKLGVESSPAGLAAADAVARTKKNAEIAAANAATDATPIRNVKNTVYYDPNNFTNQTLKSGNTTFKQANDAGWLPVTRGSKDEQNVKSYIDLSNTLDQLRALVPKVAPIKANSARQYGLGLRHALSVTSNADMNKFRDLVTTSAMEEIRAINGRTTGAELKLSPDILPSIGGLGHPSDTQQEMYNKIEHIRDMARNKVTAGIYEGTADEDHKTINDAIDGAK